MRALQGVVDGLVPSSTGTLLWWLAGLGALVGGRALGQRALDYLRLRLQQAAELRLTQRLLVRAGTVPLADFETPAFADRLNRARAGIRNEFARSLELTLQATARIAQILGIVIALARMNPLAAALLMGAGLPAWLVQLWIARQQVELYRAQTERERRASYLAGVLTGRAYAAEVRLFDVTAPLMERWRVITGDIVAERLRYTLKRGTVQSLTGAVAALGYLAAALLVGAQTLAAALTLGQFAAALRAGQQAQRETIDLLYNLSWLSFSADFAGDYWQVAGGREPAAGPPASATPGTASHPAAEVVLEGVSFAYPGSTRPALSSVSFRVQPGELVALVGENGAGKSTLVKLLLGLYEPTEGRLTIDGGAAGSGAPHGGTRAAAVFQDYLRFSLTAGENIGIGDVAGLGNKTRIRAAAEQAGAARQIESLPQGYDTPLGKEFADGQDLSGGQWQKLAIARGHMREASLLVLDEPTAALDPQAEVEVFRRLRSLALGRTTFLVSHRLGAARLADRILVLDQGQVVEEGHHNDLVGRGGIYAAMFQAQAQWYS